MFNTMEIHCWPLIKYKQIKRNGREETNNVQVAVDEKNKRIGVFSSGEEVEQVFYHMEVTRYPVLKFKDNHLYVISNHQGQGFRLSFRSQEKANFLSVMRRQAFISESPAKRSSSIGISNERVQEWTDPYSFSQPLMPPPKRNAVRNLSLVQEFRHSPSPITSFSQSVHDPYSRPLSSDGSLSSSIGSALSSLSEHTDFTSCSGFSQCSSQQSVYSPINFDNSPIVPPPSTTPAPLPELVDKCVQTDELSQLANNPEYVMSCMKTLIKEKKFHKLMKNMRKHIRKMPANELNKLFEETKPCSSDNSVEPITFLDL